MKIRSDFVTNSSSSSFIITNTSDEAMTSEQMVRKIFEKVIEDSKDKFELEPGESITLLCSDHADDSLFESFVHNFLDGYIPSCFDTDHIDVQLKESYH